MKKNTDRLEADTFYHIYNRGINSTAIFKEDKNYHFFLEKYWQHLNPVVDTYAYCLLKNHFHFLVKTKPEENMDRSSNSINVVSKKFSNLFNSYSQAFNKVYSRTGGLFETPFRRIKVNTDEYFTQLIYYIHFNPQKHNYIKDFREYAYSSYNPYLSNGDTKLQRAAVFSWFGGEKAFKRSHEIGLNYPDQTLKGF